MIASYAIERVPRLSRGGLGVVGEEVCVSNLYKGGMNVFAGASVVVDIRQV